MSGTVIEFVPTSTATTTDTEPAVVAGIASGDLDPCRKLSIRAESRDVATGRMLLLVAAALAVGYGVYCLRRSH